MDNTMTGAEGNDSLLGSEIDDSIIAYGGNDTLDGQAGSDSLDAGSGDDQLIGGFGNDTLLGGDGNDSLTDDQGSNYLDGGSGGDSLSARSLTGSQTLIGGLDNDSLSATGVSVNLDGGQGSDNLWASGAFSTPYGTSFVVDGSAYLDGGIDNDTLYADWYSQATLIGGDGQDNLNTQYTTSSTLQGGMGDDQLRSYSCTNASLQGGMGDDQLQSNFGTYASLQGDAGNDHLYAERTVFTTLSGGDGSDSLQMEGNWGWWWDGNTRTALLDGGIDNDNLNVNWVSQATLIGGQGDDSLTANNVRLSSLQGDTGNDYLNVSINFDNSYYTDGSYYLPKSATLDGGDGNDSLNLNGTVVAWAGQTTANLIGGSGNDQITVTEGNAANNNSYGYSQIIVDGGDGNDSISVTGAVQATLTGGLGSDTFAITSGQYRTQLQGTRWYNNANADSPQTVVDATPLTITDFAAGSGGDVLDVRELLMNSSVGFDGTNPFASGFLSLEQVGADTHVRFDADATGATSPLTVAVLQNVNASSLIGHNFNPVYATDGSATPGVALSGTEDADSLLGQSGDDSIVGYGGNDTLDGQAGSDSLDAGSGDDQLIGGFGNDTLLGGDGNDSLTDDQGSNYLDGGSGGDSLSARSLTGSQTLIGGLDNDSLSATGVSVNLDGGQGSDNLWASGAFSTPYGTSFVVDGSAYLDGGIDNDTLYADWYSQATLIGGDGQDNLNTQYTTSSTLQGGMGDDQLRSYSCTNASLQGGMGDDQLQSNFGTYASLQGDAGNDHLYAERTVFTTLSGGDGSDSLQMEGNWGWWWDGNTRTALLDGGIDNDNLNVNWVSQATLIGGQGDDSLTANNVRLSSLQGDTGNDYLNVSINFDNSYYTDGSYYLPKSATLDGGDGNDSLNLNGTVVAWAGQTTANLIGGSGNDQITVTEGNAANNNSYGYSQIIVDGGDGNDSISVTGAVQATLTGGLGSDTFAITSGQYRTQLQGTRWYNNANADSPQTVVDATPLTITDFAAGSGGDVLDVRELLMNSSVGFDGTNPFASGFLSLEQVGADTHVRFDADATGATSPLTVAVLQNVNASSLIGHNFNPVYATDGSATPGVALSGTEDADSLLGQSGDDSIVGYGGNDTLDGQAGSDSLDAGSGDDQLIGGFGNDTLLGGDGNDSLTDDQGSNYLDGGSGGDSLSARSLTGSQTLIGGLDNDSLSATGVSVNLDGGQGSDNLWASGAFSTPYGTSFVVDGSAYLDGGIDNDTLYADWYSQATLIGGDGQDNLNTQYTTSSTLQGGMGDDQLRSYSCTNASLQGGMGDDQLQSNFGTYASLQGDAGNDHLYAERTVFTTLSGGDGSDSLQMEGNWGWWWDGNTRTALLDGGIDNDNLNVNWVSQATLIGGQGDDSLTANNVRLSSLQGDTGNDYLNVSINFDNSYYTDGSYYLPKSATLDGGDGNDSLNLNGTVVAWAGQTTANLIGGSGNDQITVTEGNAANNNSYGYSQIIVDGGDGNDSISVTGAVQATLTGGLGSDTFAITSGQYRTQLQGTRWYNNANADSPQTVVDATPLTITDFAAGTGGDVLDVRELLMNSSVGFDGTNPFASGYLSLEQVGADTYVRFDADATGATSPLTVAVLQNVNASSLIGHNFNPVYATNGAVWSNSRPSGVVTIFGDAVQGATLTASNSLSDPDGMGAISYQWQVDGSNIWGATSDSFTLGQAEVGHAISVVASYTDGYGMVESVFSVPTAAVADVNEAPAVSGPVSFYLTDTSADDVFTSMGGVIGAADADGDPLSFAIRGGAAVGNVVTKVGTYGTLSIDTNTGEYAYAPRDAAIERLVQFASDTFTIQVSDGREISQSSVTIQIDATNDLPTGSVDIAGSPAQGQMLSASHSLADREGMGAVTYQWVSNGVPLSSQALDVELFSISAPTFSSDGTNTVQSFTIRYNAGLASGIDLNAAVLDLNVDTSQIVEAIVTSSSNLTQVVGDLSGGQSRWQIALTTTDVFVPGDEISVSLVLQPGTPSLAVDFMSLDQGGVSQISTSQGANFWLDGAQPMNISSGDHAHVILSQGEVNTNISVSASYIDQQGTSESVVSAITSVVANINNLPVGEVNIAGVATQGQVLSVTHSLADVDGLGTVSYQWQADGVDIAGANRDSLTLTQAQVGKSISVIASYTDGFGARESVASEASSPVANVNDAPTGYVAIRGGIVQGQTLTADPLLGDVDGMGAMSYQWMANGLEISGATNSTYTLTKADAGTSISVMVSYTDLQGTAEQVSSNAFFVEPSTTTVETQTYLWKSHGLVSGVQLVTDAASATTNAEGFASMDLPIDLSQSIEVSKTLNSSEQTTADSAVNLQDAIAILKMIVGLDVNGAGKALSPYQSLAADFDGNGTVSLTDAIGVLKHVVGLASPEPTLKFVDETNPAVSNISANPLKPGTPPAIHVDTTDITAVHLGAVGYLSGDVDGSYTGGATTTLPLEYFSQLHTTTGISLTQFGVYGG